MTPAMQMFSDAIDGAGEDILFVLICIFGPVAVLMVLLFGPLGMYYAWHWFRRLTWNSVVRCLSRRAMR
jgi:hypothetical protein